MKFRAFSTRVLKDILRDPLNILFGLGFPLVVLFLLSAIQANIPPQGQMPLFELSNLAPGVSVFGLSFLTLFSAQLIAKDRESALLQRLYTTPLAAPDFILGYALPVLPIALMQGGVCYLASLALGLAPTVNILWALVSLLPVSLLFIALGLLCGSLMGVKQVGGVCGALLTNLTAWLSGIWFDVALVGGAFEAVADLLPFRHAVELERAVLRGDWPGMFPHLWWVLCYAAGLLALAIWAFLRQMKRQ